MSEAPAFLSIDACVGLHSSASTWVFNVARELRQAAAPDDTLSIYADDLVKLPPQPGKRLVLKSHHGSDDLEAWLLAEGATLILSTRDPRDAAVSMSQRFAAPLEVTAPWIASDCKRLLRLAPRARALLRYEQRFFEQPEIVGKLAQLMQVPASPTLAGEIFERYRTENVKAFARTLNDLPPERTQQVGAWRMDKLTQIHGPHIGDGAVGKWRALPEPARGALRGYFRDIAAALGYEP